MPKPIYTWDWIDGKHVGISEDRVRVESKSGAVEYVRERTCQPLVSPDGAGWYAIGCSNCGYGFADNSPDKEYLLRISKRRDIMPRYCSGCGSKVEVVE